MALRALTLEVVGRSCRPDGMTVRVRRPNRLVVRSPRCHQAQKCHGTASTRPRSGWQVFRPGGKLAQSVAPTAWWLKVPAAPPRSVMALRALALKVVGWSFVQVADCHSPLPQLLFGD